MKAIKENKFGMFIHWGIYAQLGLQEQAIARYDMSHEEYEKLAETFTAEDFDAEEQRELPRQWGNLTPEQVANHNEAEAVNVLRRQHHISDITARDFVEVCVDLKQQGVAGYDSWGARPEPAYTLPANRDYQWGFTLIPLK